MSKKTTGFDLINSNFGKYPLAHHSYIYYHLVSFDLYAQSNLHRVKTRPYFKDQPVSRCEAQEVRRLNYFFEIFYCNLHYYKRLVPKLKYSTLFLNMR